jgi:hypothetical protein
MRKSFFDEPSSQEELLARSQSTDPFERWTAAVELGHVAQKWAVPILWEMKTDNDENTRVAALASLANYSDEEISKGIGESGTPRIHVAKEYREWKTRTLPELSDDTSALFETVVLDILGTEGPTTGNRIFRLIGTSVNPNNKYVVSKNSLKKILRTLVARNVITRSDFNPSSDELDVSTFHLTGQPGVVVRRRGNRLLEEIPLAELKETIRNDPRASRRRGDADFLFKVVAQNFEISHLEYHIVGRLLEREWFGLFASNSDARESDDGF